MSTTAKPRSARAAIPASCAYLARSRNLKHLWMVRILVHIFNRSMTEGFMPPSTRPLAAAIRQFRIPCVGGLNVHHSSRLKTHEKQFESPAVDLDDSELYERLLRDIGIAWEYMEARSGQFKLGSILSANLEHLACLFSLTKTERLILALAVLFTTDDILFNILSMLESSKIENLISTVLNIPELDVIKATSEDGCLRKCNLIKINRDREIPLRFKFGIGQSSLQEIVYKKLISSQNLFSKILNTGSSSTLCFGDYPHLRPDIGFISGLLKEALQSKRRGVNILLYGFPGTGKTECARLLAQELTAPLYEVSFQEIQDSAHGRPQEDNARGRLQAAATAQYLLRDNRALLLFDEADAVFNNGSRIFGKQSTAESLKAWINDLLEKNGTPTIWTMNGIGGMDPAFVRRFDLAVEMKSPPLRQRELLLEKLCGDTLNTTQIHRFAQVEAVTPAVIVRAASVVQRAECGNRPRAELLEAVLDGTLAAQGHDSVRRSCRGLPAENYDVSLCNADADLNAIAQGIAKTGTGRICLYGPPGTGKTAFGYWLAKELGRPLVLKRVSDIQSPFIGVMERKLAAAFEAAERDQAVLQIDEVDTYLQDRRGAQMQWEISQTNEFLTQLESFSGVFIASTNLMDGLDQAILRRFDYKIRVGYMRSDQAQRMLERLLHDWNLPQPGEESTARLARMTNLTPGDFALIRRRHLIVPFANAHAILDALQQEVEMKEVKSRRIGFV